MLHAGSARGVAGFLRLVEDSDLDLGDIAVVEEKGRNQCLAGIPGLVEPLCGHQPFGQRDFSKRAAHPHILDAGLSPHISIPTASFKIDFANRHGPAWRTEQPALHQVWFGKCVEDQLTGCAEIASDLNFTIARQRYLKGVGIDRRGSLLACFTAWFPFLRWDFHLAEQTIQTLEGSLPESTIFL